MSLDKMTNIKQKKGEAELAQINWMKEIIPELSEGDSVLNYMTSADIDTLVIHMFAISLNWPRNRDSTFKFPVYLLLQKTNPELYNISGIIELIEKHFSYQYAAALVALVLSMGGNDYLSHYYGISHEKILSKVCQEKQSLSSLFGININSETHKVVSITLDTNKYISLMKELYCPKLQNPHELTFAEVRQLTIKPPNKEFRHPQTRMPPESALRKLGSLIQCHIDYLMSTWNHEADLPKFLEYGCLVKTADGDIIYDLGDGIHVSAKSDFLTIPETQLHQKLASKQRRRDETPKKVPRKRLPVMASTPRKGNEGKVKEDVG